MWTSLELREAGLPGALAEGSHGRQEAQDKEGFAGPETDTHTHTHHTPACLMPHRFLCWQQPDRVWLAVSSALGSGPDTSLLPQTPKRRSRTYFRIRIYYLKESSKIKILYSVRNAFVAYQGTEQFWQRGAWPRVHRGAQEARAAPSRQPLRHRPAWLRPGLQGEKKAVVYVCWEGT